MPQNQLVQARINEKVKAQAAAVLAEVGLTVSDVVRIVLTRIAQEKTIPLELLTPNATTLAAMEEARNYAGLPRAHSVKELFEALNGDD